MTKFTSLALGVVTASVITTAVTNSFITRGDVIFDTTSNTTPSVVADTTDVITLSGADTVRFNVPMRTSLAGSLALSEENGSCCSGTLVVQNTSQSYLACDRLNVLVTTTASPTTYVDIYASTGTTVRGTSGTGTHMANNFSFPVGLTSFTGARIGRIKGTTLDPDIGSFVLEPTGTTGTGSIIFASSTGTGQGLAGSYWLDCQYIQ